MGVLAVPLTQGKQALIDEEDWPLVREYNWYAIRSSLKPDLWYAATHPSTTREGKRPVLLMHRLLLGAPKGSHVDHTNGDGLDNRRGNLRSATSARNGANRRRRTDTASGYKGVYRKEGRNQWEARITGKGRRYNLGLFPTAEEAAAAYDGAAAVLFGAFARPNTPAPVEDAPRIVAVAPKRTLRSSNTSGYVGISGPHPQTGRYQARICHQGKTYILGYHATPEDAARAYDAKVRELLGPDARLNFPAAD